MDANNTETVQNAKPKPEPIEISVKPTMIPAVAWSCKCGSPGVIMNPKAIEQLGTGKMIDIVCQKCQAPLRLKRSMLVGLPTGRRI